MKTRLLISVLGLALSLPAIGAVDEPAARALAKKEGCLKCHGIDEEKEAKSLTDIARKYKGKADANARMMEQITSGAKVKTADGSEDEHKIVKTKDKAALGNMLDWIRSLAK
jgi:cytochrome c